MILLLLCQIVNFILLYQKSFSSVTLMNLSISNIFKLFVYVYFNFSLNRNKICRGVLLVHFWDLWIVWFNILKWYVCWFRGHNSVHRTWSTNPIVFYNTCGLFSVWFTDISFKFNDAWKLSRYILGYQHCHQFFPRTSQNSQTVGYKINYPFCLLLQDYYYLMWLMWFIPPHACRNQMW